MIKLSVNVNKVATIRNSRGGSVPSVLEAAGVAVDAGAHGITVHPRADARHITFRDVEALADILSPLRGRIEFNIEGDPRPICSRWCAGSDPINARWSPSRRARSPAKRGGRPRRRPTSSARWSATSRRTASA